MSDGSKHLSLIENLILEFQFSISLTCCRRCRSLALPDLRWNLSKRWKRLKLLNNFSRQNFSKRRNWSKIGQRSLSARQFLIDEARQFCSKEDPRIRFKKLWPYWILFAPHELIMQQIQILPESKFGQRSLVFDRRSQTVLRLLLAAKRTRESASDYKSARKLHWRRDREEGFFNFLKPNWNNLLSE